MAKDSLTCSDTTCERGLDLNNPPSNEALHISEYHRETLDIKHMLCLSLTFHRLKNNNWSFQCSCGGSYKPTQSFKRHVNNCPEMANKIQESYLRAGTVKTDAYEIHPRDTDKRDNPTESVAINNVLMFKLYNEIVQSREDMARQAELQHKALSAILSTLQSQNKMLKATQDLLAVSRNNQQLEHELNRNGKRLFTDKTKNK